VVGRAHWPPSTVRAWELKAPQVLVVAEGDGGARDADQLVEVDIQVDHRLPGAAAAAGEVVQDHPGGDPLCTQLALLRRGELACSEVHLKLRALRGARDTAHCGRWPWTSCCGGMNARCDDDQQEVVHQLAPEVAQLVHGSLPAGIVGLGLATTPQIDELLREGAVVDIRVLGILAHRRHDPRLAEVAWARAACMGDATAAYNLGFLHAEHGRVRLAIRAYELAMTLGDPDGAFGIGRLYEEGGRLAVAEAWFRRGVAAESARCGFQLGALLDRGGEFDAAAEAYRAAAALGMTQASLALGDMLWRLGQTAEAADVYDRAASAGNTEAALRMGTMQLAIGDEEAALASYARAAAGGESKAWHFLGIAHRDAGRRAPAVAALNAAIAQGDGAAARTLGALHEREHDLEAAAGAYRQGLTLGEGGCGFALGAMLAVGGDEVGAIAAYEEGAALGDADSAFNLGNLHRDAGRRRQTVAAFELAAKLGDAPALSNLAVLHFESGERQEALSAWRRAFAAEVPAATIGLASMLAASGEIDEAVVVLRTGSDRGDIHAARLLCQLLRDHGRNLELGEHLEAVYRKGGDVEGDDVDAAQEWLGVGVAFGHARSAHRLGRIALAQATETVEDVYDLWRWASMRGHMPAAWDGRRLAAVMGPDDDRAWWDEQLQLAWYRVGDERMWPGGTNELDIAA
jgi:tetratricopeptide (TPR) repeat protein